MPHATSALRLFDELGDVVFVVDRDGLIVEANGAMPSGGALWDQVPSTRVSQRKVVIAQVLNTQQPIRFTDQVDGRWTEVCACPSAAGDNVVFVYRDIDSRVRAEEELKRLRLRVLTIQEEERRAISQDLHDEVGQGMTALLIDVKGLADEYIGAPELHGRVRDIVQQVETLTKRMRQLFYRLRPPALDASPLPEALRDYCSSFAHFSRLRIHFDADDQVPILDDPQATALYRLLQECLNNVAKHAHAGSVWVSLTVDDECVSLVVEDDGIGFDPATVPAGLGLKGLRERFAMFDGQLEIEARPGAGVRAYGSVPLAAEARA